MPADVLITSAHVGGRRRVRPPGIPSWNGSARIRGTGRLKRRRMSWLLCRIPAHRGEEGADGDLGAEDNDHACAAVKAFEVAYGVKG